MTQLHPRYITDNTGQKVSVVITVVEFEELLEDLNDLAAIVERRDEPSISHEDLLASLKLDGLI